MKRFTALLMSLCLLLGILSGCGSGASSASSAAPASESSAQESAKAAPSAAPAPASDTADSAQEQEASIQEETIMVPVHSERGGIQADIAVSAGGAAAIRVSNKELEEVLVVRKDVVER